MCGLKPCDSPQYAQQLAVRDCEMYVKAAHSSKMAAMMKSDANGFPYFHVFQEAYCCKWIRGSSQIMGVTSTCTKFAVCKGLKAAHILSTGTHNNIGKCYRKCPSKHPIGALNIGNFKSWGWADTRMSKTGCEKNKAELYQMIQLAFTVILFITGKFLVCRRDCTIIMSA